jgi:hypothetical protein
MRKLAQRGYCTICKAWPVCIGNITSIIRPTHNAVGFVRDALGGVANHCASTNPSKVSNGTPVSSAIALARNRPGK